MGGATFLLNSEVQVILSQINILFHKINHCILGELVTKYVDLTKNNLYVDDN